MDRNVDILRPDTRASHEIGVFDSTGSISNSPARLYVVGVLGSIILRSAPAVGPGILCAIT